MHNFKFEKSSSIAECSHDGKDILTIKFTSGQTYHYHDCPKKVYDELTTSRSAGKYFHSNIMGKYNHRKME